MSRQGHSSNITAISSEDSIQLFVGTERMLAAKAMAIAVFPYRKGKGRVKLGMSQ